MACCWPAIRSTPSSSAYSIRSRRARGSPLANCATSCSIPATAMLTIRSLSPCFSVTGLLSACSSAFLRSGAIDCCLRLAPFGLPLWPGLNWCSLGGLPGPTLYGPGSPPREHQFKPGQSGNPKGAKRKQQSIAPDLKKALEHALNKPVTLKQGDKERIVSMAVAGIEQLVAQFAK